MNELWAVMTSLLAAVVGIRMLCSANKMNGRAPQRIRIGVALMVAAAFTYAVSPFFIGARFSWPDVVFAAGVAVWTHLDRRQPA